MARVLDHLSVAEVQAGYRGSGDATLARNYQTIWLLKQGRTIAETAALDRATAGALQRVRAGEPRRPAARQRREADAADAGDAGAAAGAGAHASGGRRGLDLRQGRGFPGGGTRPGLGGAAARLGGAARHRLDDPAATPAPRQGGDARRADSVQKKLAEAVAEAQARHPGAVVETFATDEHRIGLKPILRRVWAPRGMRPIAPCHHRFEWLYVTTFVSPATGESFWYLSDGVSKALFEKTLALFAREAGAGPGRIIVLVLDNAGWHTEPGLAVPEGVRLVYLPPYTPELQPAETLWTLVDEPIVNKHFETLADLDAAVSERCVALNKDRDLVKGPAGFHWWPERTSPI